MTEPIITGGKGGLIGGIFMAILGPMVIREFIALDGTPAAAH